MFCSFLYGEMFDILLWETMQWTMNDDIEQDKDLKKDLT